jgi:hypothetical protein
MITCYFCKNVHETIYCPVEKKYSSIFKLYTGYFMEYFTANNIKCPECKKNKLKVIGDNSPSNDLICKNCKQIFEIKSKCLSSSIIPKDIIFNHGTYDKYLEQKEKGLNFIFIIYGIDRYNHNIYIREILYSCNFDIENIIYVKKNDNNAYSTINIPNRLKLNKITVPNNNIINFNNFYNDVVLYNNDDYLLENSNY